MAVVLAVLSAGSAIRQPLYDLFQRMAPQSAEPARVQVVTIDAPSLAAVGGWPWSRYTMARLTEAIAARGAKVIGYDFLFPEADRLTPQLFASLYPELPPATADEIRKLPSMDAVFARVIGRSPVVLARAGVDRGSYDTLDAAAPLPPEAQFVGPRSNRIAAYPEVVANLPILDGAALGHGLVNGPKDPDGVMRRVPLVARAAGALTPGFALELVRIAEGEDKVALEGDGGRLQAVRLGRHRLPVDAEGRMTLRFQGLAGPAVTSAVDLLRGGRASRDFAGKIVVVGLTAAGTSDVVTTPRLSETFGVLVQAEAANDILADVALSRPDWAVPLEWTLSLLIALAAWLLVPRLGLTAIVAAALGLTAVAVSGAYAAFLSGALIDPGPMILPGVATAGTMIALLFVEGGKVQARLRAALDEERLTAAKVAGELSAAAEIQAGMLLPREALHRLAKGVDVDAVVHPAKAVGGDLYDAFMIDETRLCFLVGDVTGKGLAAALFMALGKALSRSLLMRPPVALDVALANINAELSHDNGEMMALSLLVGVLDTTDGRLELCNAGFENPLLIDASGGVRELKLEGGPALCVVDSYPYPVEIHGLAPGETLVVYSDGVTEAQDTAGALFTRAAAMAVLAGGAGRPLAVLIEDLVSAVRVFEAGEDPSDDLTVLAVRRPG
ncbi:CHASE2 domain-containing protein [Phenylobacterium sp.]|uniref:CHASE2 domain-containing protein n=1 Tax=Phenylobacterium sp. TaxID=1871053 RepID=UPI00374D2020